jgi:hypothetical protein
MRKSRSVGATTCFDMRLYFVRALHFDFCRSTI